MMSAIMIIILIIMIPINAYADSNISISNDYDYNIVGYDLRTQSYINTDFSDKENDAISDKIRSGSVYIDDYSMKNRAIIGEDNRVKANVNDSLTWGSALVITKYSKDMFKCSSSLIAKNVLLTAAHCVTNIENNLENAEYVTVYPGRSDGNMPTGFYEVTQFYILNGWKNKNGIANYKYDIALMIIAPDEDNKYPTDYGAPTYGYGVYNDDNLNKSGVVAFGYTGDKDAENGTLDVMYSMLNGLISTDSKDYYDFNKAIKSNILTGIHSSENTLMHTLDTTQGSSGAGLIKTNSEAIIVGVNSRECPRNNSNFDCINSSGRGVMNTAVRINNDIYDFINSVVDKNK